MESLPLERRLNDLENRHTQLAEHVSNIHQQLTARIDNTDAILKDIKAEQKDMRADMKSDMTDLKETMHRVEIDSLKSWPPAAIEAINSANRTNNALNRTKNALIGGIVLLVVALSSVSVALWTHL